MAKRSKRNQRAPEVIKTTQVAAGEIRPAPSVPVNWKLALQTLVIVLAALWIYWPSLSGDWLWDDDRFITNNSLLRDGAGLWKIWFVPGSFIEYYPLEETVQWIQWHLWGMDTFGYHVTNLVLHILGALLVWRLLGKFGLRFAWLGGLLFAIHPVQVESVAWAVELKNTLSVPPFLLAICFYLDFDEKRRSRDYRLAVGFFLVAMLCKITMALFPFMILLYAWWKRNRIGWDDLKHSAPFFAVSLLLGIITMLGGVWDHQFDHPLPGYLPDGGVWGRIDLAGLALAFYFWKSLWPVDLLPTYPKWTIDITSPIQFLPWPILAGIIFWFWAKRRGWGRHALLGVGFFLLNLAPCPGLIPAPNMGYAWVMDHFLYLPIVGLIGLAVAALEQAENRLSLTERPYCTGIVAVTMALMTWESRGYAALYVNLETLWSYTLQENPDAFLAHNNLGFALAQKGRTAEAIEHFREAVRINPLYADGHANLGLLLMNTGKVSEALSELETAAQINPGSFAIHYNYAVALDQAGRTVEAIEQYRETLALSPRHIDAHNNLGVALAHENKIPEALAEFEAALQIDPNRTDIRNNLTKLQAYQQAAKK